MDKPLCNVELHYIYSDVSCRSYLAAAQLKFGLLCRIIMLGCVESYSSARLHLARAEDTSGLETDAGDQIPRKRKRTLLTFSDESDIETHEKVTLGGKSKRTTPVSRDETAPDNSMSLLQPPVPMDLNFTAGLKSVGKFYCVTVYILGTNSFFCADVPFNITQTKQTYCV